MIFFDLMALLIGSFWVRNSFLPMSTSFLTNDYPALPDHYISLSHYITVSHYISLSLTVYHCLSLSQTVPPYSSAISTLTSDWLLPHPLPPSVRSPSRHVPPKTAESRLAHFHRSAASTAAATHPSGRPPFSLLAPQWGPFWQVSRYENETDRRENCNNK